MDHTCGVLPSHFTQIIVLMMGVPTYLNKLHRTETLPKPNPNHTCPGSKVVSTCSTRVSGPGIPHHRIIISNIHLRSHWKYLVDLEHTEGLQCTRDPEWVLVSSYKPQHHNGGQGNCSVHIRVGPDQMLYPDHWSLYFPEPVTGVTGPD